MPCLHLLISGRVQGVWFRESMRQEAIRQNVTGWVRNLRDGRVEAVVCGDEAAVQAMLAWAKRGPQLAKVTNVEVLERPDEVHVSFEKRN